MTAEELGHVPVAARRARWAGSAYYASQGVCFAALVTRIPALKDRFGLDEATLALLLAVVPLLAGVGSVLAGGAAGRVGAARVLRLCGPVVPLALVAVGASPTLVVLVLVLVVLGLGLGAVDAAMNAHGVAVQREYRRSLMSSFFAVFSLAGIVGAALAAVAAGSDLSLAAFFAIVAVVILPVQLVAAPRLLPALPEAAPRATSAVGPGSAVPWRPVVLIGIALACVYIADSAASNWSAVYLTDALGSTESQAALAFLLYALATLVARTVVDRRVMVSGPVRLVRVAGLIACGAALLVAAAPTWPIGLLAFAVLGVGVAPVIPLAFSAAASHDPHGSGVAVSRVNVFNYVGFVLGAPLVGLVAEATDLRVAFALLAPVLLVVVVLAPRFAHVPGAAHP